MNWQPANIIKRLLARVVAKTYRVRDDQRKLVCPHPDYDSAFVVMPQEWLGAHVIRKDRAITLVEQHGSLDITNMAVCLALLDDWGNIPGIDSKDMSGWDVTRVPVPIMAWLVDEVLADFSAAYIVPKASSPPSQEALMAEDSTAGSSVETTPS